MNESHLPFTKALAQALRTGDHPSVDETGNINWTIFARSLPTIHYETLRKIRAGERALDRQALEEVAKAAGVEPEYFGEYRLIRARERFDPSVIGLDEALANLERHLSDRPGGRRKPATS